MFSDIFPPEEDEMFHCNELLVVGQATEKDYTSGQISTTVSATCKTHIEATCGQKLSLPGVFISGYFILKYFIL